MRTHRTEEEINEITVYASEVGLDGRIAMLCEYRYQVLRLFELQERMNERRTVCYCLRVMAPKDRIKEYNAAIKHKESLAIYLFDSGQLEALEALKKVEINENEPKVKSFIARNRQYLREEVTEMSISKSNIDEVVNILMEYLLDKIESEYTEFKAGSLSRQIQEYLAQNKHIKFLENKNK